MQRDFVPLIPGMMSTHHQEMSKPDFRKRQILEQMSVGKASGIVTAKDIFTAKLNQFRGASRAPPSSPPNGFSSAAIATGGGNGNNCNLTDEAARNGKTRSSAPTGVTSTKYRVDATQPKWITNDRQVLRFYGFFREKVQENGHDTLRTRRVVLCFYLSDCAISISEPRIANSGMAQGEFMKRTVATKPNGSSFTPEDFRIGGELRLYGRVFHIVDCDDATRTYYEEAIGRPLESSRRYPDDHSSHADEIEAIKTKLRAKTTAIVESKAEAVRKFHENSQKVLRFYLSWQDPHPLYPETRKYILHYYLCDDTIEIVEPKEERERVGRGHFAVLLSRRRVMKDDKMMAIQALPEHPKGRLLTDRDLRCGEWVYIFSRKFLLEDCDPFTRDYYLETHGVTQEKYEPPPTVAEDKPSKWKLFQPTKGATGGTRGSNQSNSNGFSSAMLQRLEAHVQDNEAKTSKFYQSDALDKKQLRFRARFHGLKKDDMNSHREFTLTYFLEDDTLSVFEPRVKNSGVTGGRFLDRGRFRKCFDSENGGTASRENQKERSAYCASDFYIGAIVRFEFSPTQRLELIEADQQTLSYCESHPDLFPYSSVRMILQQLVQLLARKQKCPDLRCECRNLDRKGKRAITVDDFKRVLQTLDLYPQLNAQQLVTLCRKFSWQEEENGGGGSSHEDSLIAYDEFCDDIALTMMKLDDRSRQHQLNDAWYSKLTKVPNLRHMLRRADTNRVEVVPGDVFLKMVSFYHVGLSARDLEAVMSKYSRKGGVEYHKLCDRVFQLPDFAANGGVSTPQQPRPRELDESNNFSEDEYAQYCEPPPALESPSRATPTMAPLQLPPSKPVQSHSYSAPAAPRPSSGVVPATTSSRSRPSDPRVVELLQRVFGSRKYQLRKALRERDMEKTGLLGEEEFMDAVLSVEPKLSDDDTYAIADAYFPTNNCQLDYAKLLESAFRT